jgi:hypothetical protein
LSRAQALALYHYQPSSQCLPATERVAKQLGFDWQTVPPEAGLYFQEEFNQRDLAKSGADQRIVNLIFDIERLRTFYQLSWNVFNKGIGDVRATTWKEDEPTSPDSITPMIATSSAAMQNIYKAIMPYIDKQLPSKKALEARFMQTKAQQINRDYPTQKK